MKYLFLYIFIFCLGFLITGSFFASTGTALTMTLSAMLGSWIKSLK